MGFRSLLAIIAECCKASKRIERRFLQIHQAVKNSEQFSGLIVNYHKSGKPFLNSLHIHPVFTRHGDLNCFVGTQTPLHQCLVDHIQTNFADEQQAEQTDIRTSGLSNLG